MTDDEKHISMMAAKIAAPLLAQAPTPKEDGEFERTLDSVASVSVILARLIARKTTE